MPYAPLGYQTPIPPAGRTLWDDPGPGYYPNTELRAPAIASYPMARQPLEEYQHFVDRQTGDVLPHIMGPLVSGPLGFAMKAAPVTTRALMDFLPFGITPAYGADKKKDPGPPDPQVKALQLDLQRKGYDVETDGYRGPKTQEAMKLDAAKTAGEEQRALERQKLELEKRKQTQEETAATQAAELKGAQIEAGKTAQKRYEELGKPTTWGEIAPYAGGIAGAGEALIAQLLLGKKMSAGTRATTAEGERVIDTMGRGRVPSGDVPTRIGRVSEYADIGGAKQMPFTPIQNPGATQEYPWTPNPNATPFNKLYRPGIVANFGPSAISGGVAGAEYGYGTNKLENARAERQTAEKDFAELSQRGATGPEYENVLQRLQKARHDEAMGDFFERMGQGAGVMTGIMGAKQYVAGQRSLPQGSGRMEAERGRLNAILNQQAPLSPAPLPGGPTPLPVQPPPPLALPPPAANPRTRHPKGAVDKDGNKIGGRYITEEDNP